MTIRFFRAALCLPLLVISCDEKEQANRTTADKSPARRSTKSDRPGGPAEKKQAHDQRRAALAAAKEIPSPEERNRRISEWIWDAFELDPELAREGFELLTPGSQEKNSLLGHYAMRLAEQDMDAAKSWAASLETDEEKSLAFGKIAMVISEEDPEGAARLLSDSGVAGREFDVAVVQVIQKWGSTAPASAADWVVRFDNSDSRKAGLKAICSTWMSFDPEASMSWISSISNETIRKEAIGGYAEAAFEHPPMIREVMLGNASPEIRSRVEELEARAREAESEEN